MLLPQARHQISPPVPAGSLTNHLLSVNGKPRGAGAAPWETWHCLLPSDTQNVSSW